MCDIGFGRRIVFRSEERIEQMRKREGRERREIMRERREKFQNKKVIFVHTIMLQYHHIFTMVL